MKKTILSIILLANIFSLFAQDTIKSVIAYETNGEIKNSIVHIRALKGDKLIIYLQTEAKNAKKDKYYDLNVFRLYRQFADQDFQYIIDKTDVSNIENLELKVPSDGIYTFQITRGGMKKFNTHFKIERKAENSENVVINKKAMMVEIPDTIHTYTNDSVVYDYVRQSIPKIRKDTTRPYYEDQIFMDRAYALRAGNKYAIPIVMPMELWSTYKKSKSVKWGFMISVSDNVYKALQGKVSDIASAGVSKGVGKMMSGKVDKVTGQVQKSGKSKAYKVFDKASEANAWAGIAGDVGEVSGSEKVEGGGDAVATITGFTGLSDVAGGKIAGFVPKIEDKVKYKVLSQSQYKNYINKQSYSTLKKGTEGFVTAEFPLNNPNDVYYLIIENERNYDGGALDVLETIGKNMLSQYVYLSVKVYVQRETVVTYDKGYFERALYKLFNPVWHYEQTVNKTTRVIWEDEMKPYYRALRSSNIY